MSDDALNRRVGEGIQAGKAKAITDPFFRSRTEEIVKEIISAVKENKPDSVIIRQAHSLFEIWYCQQEIEHRIRLGLEAQKTKVQRAKDARE